MVAIKNLQIGLSTPPAVARTAMPALEAIEGGIKTAGSSFRLGRTLGIAGIALTAVGIGVWAYYNRDALQELIHPNDIKPSTDLEKEEQWRQMRARQFMEMEGLSPLEAFQRAGLDAFGNLSGKIIQGPAPFASASAAGTSTIISQLLDAVDTTKDPEQRKTLCIDACVEAFRQNDKRSLDRILSGLSQSTKCRIGYYQSYPTYRGFNNHRQLLCNSGSKHRSNCDA